MLKRRTASAGFFSQIWDNKKKHENPKIRKQCVIIILSKRYISFMNQNFNYTPDISSVNPISFMDLELEKIRQEKSLMLCSFERDKIK